MPNKFQPARGTRDFMPAEMARRQYIFDTVRKVFQDFGYQPLETPAFESWELLGAKGGGGEAIKDEVYLFRDKGNRQMGLRFDLTVPLARVVANNPQLPKPFKRYQIGPVWRYDNPQAGRFREFWQADADVIGSASMAADAECIALFAECLMKLGFRDFEIRLNNRKLLNGIMDAIGIGRKKSLAVFRALDKLEKQGEDAVGKELIKAGIKPKQSETLMNIINAGGRPKEAIKRARKLLEGFMEAVKGLDELEEIVELSGSHGVADRITIDLSLVRGLDYYTGPIYEISANSNAGTSVGSIAGGGRYDNLIELYGGSSTPATGGSLGIERICEIMSAEGMFKDIPASRTRVLVAAARDEPKLRQKAIETAQKLRSEGIAAETDLMGRKLKKGLDYATGRGIPYIIIIGDKELKSGRLALRDMAKREQKSMPLQRILKILSI